MTLAYNVNGRAKNYQIKQMKKRDMRRPRETWPAKVRSEFVEETGK